MPCFVLALAETFEQCMQKTSMHLTAAIRPSKLTEGSRHVYVSKMCKEKYLEKMVLDM